MVTNFTDILQNIRNRIAPVSDSILGGFNRFAAFASAGSRLCVFNIPQDLRHTRVAGKWLVNSASASTASVQSSRSGTVTGVGAAAPRAFA